MFDSANTDDFVSLADFAKAIGRSDRGIRKAIERGAIVSYRKVGKLYKVHRVKAANELGIAIPSFEQEPKAEPLPEKISELSEFKLSSFTASQEKAKSVSENLSSDDSILQDLKIRQHQAKTAMIELDYAKARLDVVSKTSIEHHIVFLSQCAKSAIDSYVLDRISSSTLEGESYQSFERSVRADAQKMIDQIYSDLEKKKAEIRTTNGYVLFPKKQFFSLAP